MSPPLRHHAASAASACFALNLCSLCFRSGSSGGYSCGDAATAYAGDGLVILEKAVNNTNGSVVTSLAVADPNATVVFSEKTSRWCCTGSSCNEPTQMRIDRVAATAAALAAAYAEVPSLGFTFMQDPSWLQGSSTCPMTNINPLYVPMADFAMGVGEVGQCKPFNMRGLLSDILEQYTGTGTGRNWRTIFMAHCVECDTMPGDGASPFAISERRTAARHYFYADRGCDQLTLLYAEDYSLGRCTDAPWGSNYLARCGVPSVGSCPKPAEGFTVRQFANGADDSCALPIGRFVAWNGSDVGQCVTDFSPLRVQTDFLPATVQGAKVCCTSQKATLYYYSDSGCNNPHDPSADESQLGMEFDLRGCHRHDDLGFPYFAECLVQLESCPPLREIEVIDRETAGRAFIAAGSDEDTEEAGLDLMILVIALGAVVAVFGLMLATKSMWMSEKQQAKLRKLLHGEEEVVVKEEDLAPKEKSEKQKIMEQYRAVSFAEKNSSKKKKEEVPLPGSTYEDAGDDPMEAARLASEALAAADERRERQQKALRSQSEGKIRSKSHKGSGGGTRSGGSSRERGSSKSSGSVRSASERPAKKGHRGGGGKSVRSASSKQPKGKVGSKSVREKGSSSSIKPVLTSASEGGRRRTAMQHNLKQMKDLEASKEEADSSGDGNRRGDSLVACRALFDRIDVDASGTLDREEIAMLATKMGRGLKADGEEDCCCSCCVLLLPTCLILSHLSCLDLVSF